MRPIKQFQFTLDGAEIVAIDNEGDLWFADWVVSMEDDVRILQWKPLNGPPDGSHLQEHFRDRWERIEAEAKRRLADSDAIDEKLGNL